jgi:hypothetical protein
MSRLQRGHSRVGLSSEAADGTLHDRQDGRDNRRQSHRQIWISLCLRPPGNN